MPIIESALEPTLDPDVEFMLVAAIGLAMFTWIIAILLPYRFCGPWLTIMAMVQLGLGGLLFLGIRSDPSNDIGDVYAFGVAVPLVIAGSSAVAMRLAAWLFARHDRPAGG